MYPSYKLKGLGAIKRCSITLIYANAGITNKVVCDDIFHPCFLRGPQAAHLATLRSHPKGLILSGSKVRCSIIAKCPKQQSSQLGKSRQHLKTLLTILLTSVKMALKRGVADGKLHF